MVDLFVWEMVDGMYLYGDEVEIYVCLRCCCGLCCGMIDGIVVLGCGECYGVLLFWIYFGELVERWCSLFFCSESWF